MSFYRSSDMGYAMKVATPFLVCFWIWKRMKPPGRQKVPMRLASRVSGWIGSSSTTILSPLLTLQGLYTGTSPSRPRSTRPSDFPSATFTPRISCGFKCTFPLSYHQKAVKQNSALWRCFVAMSFTLLRDPFLGRFPLE